MNNLKIKCPYCKKEIDIDSKDLVKHFARNGGLARNKLSKEKLSEIGKLGALKRWGNKI